MRIALRKSGGRGEYELAGRQGSVRVGDLLEHPLGFELTPDIVIDSHSAAHKIQGKPRIRLDGSSASHAYLVLAASLLLPRPKRELRSTSSDVDFVRNGEYAITDIDIDVSSLGPAAVVLRPTTLWLGNSIGLSRKVDVARRMFLVQNSWGQARDRGEPLRALVAAHEDAVASGVHRDIEAAARNLRNHLKSEGDTLGALMTSLGVEEGDAAISSITEMVPVDSVEDEVDPADAARRAVAQWRRGVVRSASGRAFSAKVREAYSNRCVLTGEVLPKLPRTVSPGVDGAHILPWARYDLNTLRNGVCLNKLCHWAFDSGIIQLNFDDSSQSYRVSVPNRVREEAASAGMTLAYFEAMEGQIPEDRLPASQDDWPSPKYLARLNAEMVAGAAE